MKDSWASACSVLHYLGLSHQQTAEHGVHKRPPQWVLHRLYTWAGWGTKQGHIALSQVRERHFPKYKWTSAWTEISMMPRRDISQKWQWLCLLKLPQKMWFGTHRPLSLLISYISYPNLCFPPCLQENTRCFSMQHLLLLKAVRKSSLHAYLSASHLWISERCDPSWKKKNPF